MYQKINPCPKPSISSIRVEHECDGGNSGKSILLVGFKHTFYKYLTFYKALTCTVKWRIPYKA